MVWPDAAPRGSKAQNGYSTQLIIHNFSDTPYDHSLYALGVWYNLLNGIPIKVDLNELRVQVRKEVQKFRSKAVQ